MEQERREVWFAIRLQVAQLPDGQLPTPCRNLEELNVTFGDPIPEGTEWVYYVRRYMLNQQGSFIPAGATMLLPDTLTDWLTRQVVDVTARFDDALAFLREAQA